MSKQGRRVIKKYNNKKPMSFLERIKQALPPDCITYYASFNGERWTEIYESENKPAL